MLHRLTRFYIIFIFRFFVIILGGIVALSAPLQCQVFSVHMHMLRSLAET